MKFIFIIISSLLFAFDLRFNENLIEVTHGSQILNHPFSGGLNKPKIQWIDWDNDQDEDLFILDEDGYIVGSIWSEAIAAQLMDLNGFQATTARIDTLVEAREIYGEASVPTDHTLVATVMGVETKQFLKM